MFNLNYQQKIIHNDELLGQFYQNKIIIYIFVVNTHILFYIKIRFFNGL